MEELMKFLPCCKQSSVATASRETVRWRTLILVNGCRVTAIRSSDERRNGHGLHFAQIKRPASDMDLCDDSAKVMGSHLIQRLYVLQVLR
ncbi:hypothetical protein CDAR_421 [Caerostris darwini]|uniref:Uncharacterized protein n=1 Tax=Caerostris darwini TaxID=1538125 RepID=A0AAV4UCC9_9ARAC|nr:hypothetical protein CDAR_421 [Caerostris darwini]